jgi:hypothetical protein
MKSRKLAGFGKKRPQNDLQRIEAGHLSGIDIAPIDDFNLFAHLALRITSKR